MLVPSLRRLGLVGLTAVALALPATASVASTSTVDAPTEPAPKSKQYLGSAHRPQATSSAAAEEGTPDITKLSFKSSATHEPEGTYVQGHVYYTGNLGRVKTEVRVNGAYKGTVEIFYDPETDIDFFTYKSGWGAGKVVLGPSYVTEDAGAETEEPTTSSLKDSTKSGEFRVRYGLHPDAYYGYQKTGKKLSLKAYRFTMFKIHKYVTMGRTIVQVKTSKGWKDKKVLKLAANGNSPVYTFKVSGKHYYRLKVTTTDTRQGFVSEVLHI